MYHSLKHLLSNRNIIRKNATILFDMPSVFPQTIAMDEMHRKILQSNRELLVRDLYYHTDLCDHLVKHGVFTVHVMDEIKVC